MKLFTAMLLTSAIVVSVAGVALALHEAQREAGGLPASQPASPPPTTSAGAASSVDADLRPIAQLETIQKQLEAYEARVLVSEAAKARVANDYARARDLYLQAVALDPANAAAIEGRNEMLMYLGQSPESAREEVRVGSLSGWPNQITYDFNTALLSADEALASEDLERADDECKKARDTAASNPGIFWQAQIREMNARVQACRSRIDAARKAQFVRDIVACCPFVLAAGFVARSYVVARRPGWRLRRRHLAGCCRKCGYDLTGNASGICPECGTAVAEYAGTLVGDSASGEAACGR